MHIKERAPNGNRLSPKNLLYIICVSMTLNNRISAISSWHSAAVSDYEKCLHRLHSLFQIWHLSSGYRYCIYLKRKKNLYTYNIYSIASRGSFKFFYCYLFSCLRAKEIWRPTGCWDTKCPLGIRHEFPISIGFLLNHSSKRFWSVNKI